MKKDPSQSSLFKKVAAILKRHWAGVAVGIAVGVAGNSCYAWIGGILHPRYEVGAVITLGRYEQDNNETNGPEPVEWYVISRKDDNSCLLLSRYILDAKAYNSVREPVSWETCSLRAWLNGEFAEKAFTGKELKKIVRANVENPANRKTGTEGGNATLDTVFLLSADEAERCLPREIAFGISTDYAFWKGARTFDPGAVRKTDSDYIVSHTLTSESGTKTELPITITKECFWTLRTPGYSQEMVSRIFNSTYSEVYSGIGVFVDSDGVMVDGALGVRPALWYRP